MGNDLQDRIDQRKTQLNGLLIQVARLEGEIRAYEDALAIADKGAHGGANSVVIRRRPSPTPVSARDHPQPRGRKLFSNGWGEILWRASREGLQSFGIGELAGAAASVGREIPRVQIRGQIADYAGEAEYVVRVRAGEYRLTQAGVAVIASKLGEAHAEDGSLASDDENRADKDTVGKVGAEIS